eukprot:m51a1_g2510 hypothetical protein (672) ;mRNA; f:148742-153696
MGEFLPDADQPKGHTTVNLHLGWSRCSFWLELVSDLLSKGHGNSALPSLKLFYYIWLTDFPWLRCVKRKGEHRVCSICAAYWDQVCNHALTPEELMSLRTSQSQHRSDFTHERTFVVQECNACRSDAANRWCIIIDGMTAPNLPCLRCNYNNWGNCPRPGLLIMGVLDYTFNQVRYLLSMSGLWPKNQDLIGTTLLLHIVEHLRLNPTYQPRSLTLILDNPVNQNKNNVMLGILGMLVHCGFVDEVFLFFQQPGHTHNDLDQCFSSPSNYFKANNVMSLPEVPEVFTSSWANREFLRSFRVQVSDLKRCYMLANYFESCLINYSSLADLFGFHVNSPAAPDAKASLDDVCANATLAECLVSATTRTCALRVLWSGTPSWICTRYPQTAPPSDVRYDMGFAHVLLRLNATRISTRAAALAALGRVAERCLPPPSLYAYSAPSLHLDLNSDFNYLHLRLAVHAGSNITSLADAPSEYADSLVISDEFLRCARGAAEPSFDISSVQGIASGRCGNGVVEDDEQCDGTPYCAPAACTCDPGDAAVDAPKFAAAFARCFDSEEVVVRAEPTRDRWAPQVRVVLAGADPAGLYEGANAPAFFFGRDLLGGNVCFETGAASLVVAGRQLSAHPWLPYDKAHPWGDDSQTEAPGSAAAVLALLALPLAALRLALGTASN